MKNISILIFISCWAVKVSACSSFFFNSNSKFLAKNFDWYAGEGYILKNPNNQKKFAYGFRGSNVASWTSKYGSITFNQIGKEFPYGGINEKGLAIEQLWFNASHYQDNHNQEISELEWIQYQLDNYQSVTEVIKNINSLTIKPIATIHYMLADKFGNSAIIEFVDGKVKIEKQNSSFQVITNESLEESKKYAAVNKTINPESRNHFDRYCILEAKLTSIKYLNPNNAFSILNAVKENEDNYKTFWSIVYDLENLEIYFQSFENPKIKKIALSDFDFNSPCEFSQINTNIVVFKEYTREDNFKLLNSSMKMMNKIIDNSLANKHQMNPNKISNDQIYQQNYTDLKVEFSTKKKGGNIHFIFIKEDMNNDFIQGDFSVTKNSTTKIFYSFPKGEFVLKYLQNWSLNDQRGKNLFGNPSNYQTTKINLTKPMRLKIKIK